MRILGGGEFNRGLRVCAEFSRKGKNKNALSGCQHRSKNFWKKLDFVPKGLRV